MRALFAIFVALALSGCFGLPEGSPDLDDQVTISFVAVDQETGAFLVSSLDSADYERGGVLYYDAQGAFQAFSAAGADTSILTPFLVQSATGFDPIDKLALDQAIMDAGMLDLFGVEATFVVGSGGSGLGMDIEHAIVGHPVNDTFVVSSAADMRPFTGQQRTGAALPEGFQAAEATWTETDFANEFGTAAVVGEVYDWNDLLEVVVTGIEGGNVTARYEATSIEAVEVPVVGAMVVLAETADGFQYELDLVPGQRFDIRADPYGRTTLSLPAGAYESVAREGDEVVWNFAPAGYASLMDRDVDVHITLEDVVVGEVPVDPDNYGVRTSPVTYGHGDIVPMDAAGDGHDDGHDHTH